MRKIRSTLWAIGVFQNIIITVCQFIAFIVVGPGQ